ncbi:MAG: energy-coupling factor transporter transmembrane protein EcfT [Oscillospiraceae bacterium]|nr:energy-coupling factor transporter transmembrane protein EcfT [Oscillospiraceae bacterium]
MLRDITLGQYFPGDTVIHRLDPRTKLIMVMVYLVALFSAGTALTLGMMAVFLGTIICVSKTKLCLLVRGLRPLAIILVFTGTLNIFLTPGEPIFRVWILTATYEGLRHALVLLARIGMMVMGTFILTYTTSPMNLTDGLEMLLGPLKRIRVPVHELAMIMNMALRFVPTLLAEADKIMSAQKARGADFESGNILRRGQAMIPLLIPLFMSAFRRADELAIAMESRCYHGGEGRTRMRQLRLGLRDALAGLVGALLLTAIIGLGVLGL